MLLLKNKLPFQFLILQRTFLNKDGCYIGSVLRRLTKVIAACERWARRYLNREIEPRLAGPSLCSALVLAWVDEGLQIKAWAKVDYI